ncbi:MAG TPA: class I SAM-dependent methyltransferase [Balneolales bacterium]|nr:class I SAM-dependent methyltransferase [Balneolales bacterium]
MMTDYYQSGDILKQYYKFHSLFYDSTRWSFLFGRYKIIQRCLKSGIQPDSILEVGCGTGKNLKVLTRDFPDSQITGIDISSAMLTKARNKVELSRVALKEDYYELETFDQRTFDLILFSYSLSMMNPGWDRAIANACEHLKPGGHIAVVDFFDSNFSWFKRWMGVNHVRMDGHLKGELRKYFDPVDDQVKKAYLGVWDYLLFIGKKS